MTSLVITILVFLAIGAAGLVANLVVGKLVRPDKPSKAKGEIYECGEEPVGSAWIQFDLRFYVVALLFVIFDVEIAFFFPWAVVFGSATKLGDESLPEPQRVEVLKKLDPDVNDPHRAVLLKKTDPNASPVPSPTQARDFAEFAFLELLAFFGILLLGFAYLWRRGDLEWVRSVAGQSPPVEAPHAPA
jgi:NADH-quinone oxidoreductase subunit A